MDAVDNATTEADLVKAEEALADYRRVRRKRGAAA